jgi:hypothetical protein
MHVHGNFNVPTTLQASAYEQTQALAQRRAEETRRKLAFSAFALTEPGEEARSGGQAQQQEQRRRNPAGKQEDGEFAHLFSALG